MEELKREGGKRMERRSEFDCERLDEIKGVVEGDRGRNQTGEQLDRMMHSLIIQ